MTRTQTTTTTPAESKNPEMRNVALPAELCIAAEEKFRDRFSTLEDLLVTVLRELLCEDAAKMDEADRRIVEERLRNLGYL
jgi:hypothetical protein